MRSAQSFRSAFTCPMSAWWRGFVRGYGVQDGRHPLSRRRRCAGACRKGFFARQRFSGSAPDASVIKAKVLRDVRACGLKPRALWRYGLHPIRSPMLRLANCIVFLRQGLLLSTHYRQYQAASEAAVRVTSSLHALSAFGRYHPSQALKDNYATAISRLGTQLGDHTSQD